MELLYKELSYALRGCFFAVYNALGPGFKESVYHEALAIEFEKQNLNFTEHPEIQVSYQNEKVGSYKPDFVVENKVIIEIKAQEELRKLHELQLYYYLRASKHKLGFLVNFGCPKLQIFRRVLSK